VADLIVPYTPRAAFLPYHENKKRFAVTVAHRRCGKTVARLNRIIKDAVQCERLNPRFGYIAPYWVQAKEIAWQYLKHYTAPLAPLGVKYHEADLCITFGHNNATIRLYGAENAERMRGLYFDGIAPDEAQGISSVTLRTVILPCLADRQGWLDISGTPKGWNNLLGEVVKIAQASPDEWFLQILKASETGILPESELAMQRKLMSENEFSQEYLCSFDAAITGAVYGKQLESIQSQGRIAPNLYDSALPVHTAWDLGYSDKTAIWFWQRSGMEVRLIDFYQASFEDAPHYIQIIKNRGYKYGEHYVPHDAANKLLAAGGKSMIEQLHAGGIKTRLVPATSQANQIEALRWVMRNMWIDTKCDIGTQHLREYRYKWIEDRQCYSDEPRHDVNSHAADAAEIIGQVLRKEVQEKSPPKPRFLEEMTYDELFSVESSKNSTDRRV
jgi:phage terminase large subunit